MPAPMARLLLLSELCCAGASVGEGVDGVVEDTAAGVVLDGGGRDVELASGVEVANVDDEEVVDVTPMMVTVVGSATAISKGV